MDSNNITKYSYNPMNDVLFKFIFGKEEHKLIAIDFINSILGLKGSSAIKDITYKNTEMIPYASDDKLTRLDVYAQSMDGRRIDIEVQVANYHNMEQRTMFYWSQMYLESIDTGDDYIELPPTITINIMAYNFLPQAEPHSRYVLYNPDTQHQLTDILDIHFIEIKKLNTKKPIKELSKAERWIAFFTNKLTKQQKEDLMNAEPLINKAYTLADTFMMDPPQRKAYFERKMAILQYNTDHRAAYNSGYDSGYDSGVDTGKDLGANERGEETALTMFAEGETFDKILKYSKLTPAHVSDIGLNAKYITKNSDNKLVYLGEVLNCEIK